MSELINKYFPHLSDKQKSQYEQLMPLYKEWNEKINVISRKDIDELYTRHILHSLAIAKVQPFKYACEVLDLGTGGGFPGIPLAIMFPEAKFTLVDSIGKKITVVKAIAEALELKNVQAHHTRVEKIEEQYDFVVTRAVAPLSDLKKWTEGKFLKNWFHDRKNGILALKGGDLAQEIRDSGKKAVLFPISDFYREPYFEEKFVLHCAMI